jgi:BirA family biotin operon repressor/biotin-[acetyl-CoA-carboxylase] ligase
VTDLDVALLERELQGSNIGLPLSWFASTASTNDEAKHAVRQGARHGACFVAEAQTAGRGRRGRSWLAAPGQALLFSLVLDPPKAFDPSPLTLAVGLGVHQGVCKHASTPLTVKWPNDLVSGRKKVAGILVEAEQSRGALGAVVVGVGINVHGTTFPEEIEHIATSLELLGSTAGRERVLVDVLRGVAHWYERLCQGGVAAILGDLGRLDALYGEPIRVDGSEGTGAGFDDAGRLLIRRADGSVHSVLAGTVEWGAEDRVEASDTRAPR